MTDDFHDEVLDQATLGVGVLDDIRRILKGQLDVAEEAAKRERAVKGDKGDKGDTGEQGIQGIQGVQGDPGPKGDDGEPGADGAPGERGLRGFKGDRGNDGERGLQGEPGTDGRTVLNGDGPPSDRRGKSDDWYIDRLAKTIYGPKGPDGWGEPTSLKGPPGQSVTAGGFGGGGGQQVIYDDGVRIGVARDIDFQGGDPVTIDHGIARVPVASGGGGGATLSDEAPLVEHEAGSPGTGNKASRDDHVHPEFGGTPNLGNVLEEGNDPDGHDIQAATDGGSGAGTRWLPGDGDEGGRFRAWAGDGDAGGAGAVVQLNGGEGAEGGAAILQGGDGQLGADGGQVVLTGGNGNVGDVQADGAELVVGPGSGDGVTPGTVQMRTAGSTGPGVPVSDGSALTYAIASFVEPTTATPEQIANALIAAGFMAAA